MGHTDGLPNCNINLTPISLLYASTRSTIMKDITNFDYELMSHHRQQWQFTFKRRWFDMRRYTPRCPSNRKLADANAVRVLLEQSKTNFLSGLDPSESCAQVTTHSSRIPNFSTQRKWQSKALPLRPAIAVTAAADNFFFRTNPGCT